jgi:hypothetical protein
MRQASHPARSATAFPSKEDSKTMSTQKGIGFGRFFFGFASVAAIAGATGCASSGGLGGHDVLSFATAETTAGAQEGRVAATAGVRAGAARVVDAHVNPRVPVRLAVEGDEVSVRFAHPRTGDAVAHLDRGSLAAVGPESQLPAERSAAPSTEAVRIALRDGRFIVCWKNGDFERGYRVMAQAWTGGGEPIGAPVPISPQDADVLGAPQVISVDGSHAVAAFAVMADDRAEILAVSLQVL